MTENKVIVAGVLVSKEEVRRTKYGPTFMVGIHIPGQTSKDLPLKFRVSGTCASEVLDNTDADGQEIHMVGHHKRVVGQRMDGSSYDFTGVDWDDCSTGDSPDDNPPKGGESNDRGAPSEEAEGLPF